MMIIYDGIILFNFLKIQTSYCSLNDWMSDFHIAAY